MEVFTESTTKALINAHLETIDLIQWLFTLKNAEYQARSKAHIACGNSIDSNGKQYR